MWRPRTNNRELYEKYLKDDRVENPISLMHFYRLCKQWYKYDDIVKRERKRQIKFIYEEYIKKWWTYWQSWFLKKYFEEWISMEEILKIKKSIRSSNKDLWLKYIDEVKKPYTYEHFYNLLSSWLSIKEIKERTNNRSKNMIRAKSRKVLDKDIIEMQRWVNLWYTYREIWEHFKISRDTVRRYTVKKKREYIYKWKNKKLIDWAREYDINYATLSWRVRKWMPLEKALFYKKEKPKFKI